RANLEAPEIASSALRRAGEGLRRIEPLEKRLRSLRFLVTVAQRLEGEVDATLWPDAFRWTAEFREEERQRLGGTGGKTVASLGMSPAEIAETSLLGEYARDDFEDAMSRARRLPAPERLSALIMIALALRQF